MVLVNPLGICGGTANGTLEPDAAPQMVLLNPAEHFMCRGTAYGTCLTRPEAENEQTRERGGGGEPVSRREGACEKKRGRASPPTRESGRNQAREKEKLFCV